MKKDRGKPPRNELSLLDKYGRHRRHTKVTIHQALSDSVGKVLPEHYLQLLLRADDTVFKTKRYMPDSKCVSYITKLGFIQQAMDVSIKTCYTVLYFL